MQRALTGWAFQLPRAALSAKRFFIALVLSMALAGCAVQLAPAYDPSIISGLESANEETMRLFAQVSSGVTAATFGARADGYNSVIGSLDALRMSAEARPAASGGALFMRGRAANAIPTLESPTPALIAEALKPIQMMRDTDRLSGLRPMLVEGFKRSFEISMHQALTYEKALQR